MTGVQTCALPICPTPRSERNPPLSPIRPDCDGRGGGASAFRGGCVRIGPENRGVRSEAGEGCADGGGLVAGLAGVRLWRVFRDSFATYPVLGRRRLRPGVSQEGWKSFRGPRNDFHTFEGVAKVIRARCGLFIAEEAVESTPGEGYADSAGQVAGFALVLWWQIFHHRFRLPFLPFLHPPRSGAPNSVADGTSANSSGFFSAEPVRRDRSVATSQESRISLQAARICLGVGVKFARFCGGSFLAMVLYPSIAISFCSSARDWHP